MKSAIIEAAEYVESELGVLSMRPSAKRRKLVKLAQRLRAEAEGRATPPAVNESLTTGWQPIETAPKDGRSILFASLTDDHVMVGESRWDSVVGKWSWPWFSDTVPKYWMPLPTPPASDEVD